MRLLIGIAAVLAALSLSTTTIRAQQAVGYGSSTPPRAASNLYEQHAALPTRLETSPDELRDFGVASTDSLRQSEYHSPTPLSVPGATTVSTSQLAEIMARRPLVIDVRTDKTAVLRTLEGARWWPYAGVAGAANDSRFASDLAQATGGDKNREIVFSCLSNECWLSYNAALRAVHLGYRYVRWYRGGWQAWLAAGGPTTSVSRSL